MAITQTDLFDTSFNSPVDSVMDFLARVPHCLEGIYTHAGFRSVWESQSAFDIEYPLFVHALKEAQEELRKEMAQLHMAMIDPALGAGNRKDFEQRLTQAGLTGASLRLKVQLLNRLYGRWRIVGDSPDNFMEMISPLRALLKYLNKVQESLIMAVPGLLALKTINEAAEAGMDNGEFAGA